MAQASTAPPARRTIAATGVARWRTWASARNSVSPGGAPATNVTSWMAKARVSRSARRASTIVFEIGSTRLT